MFSIVAGDERSPVGETFRYADTNYVLLGLVVEQVRGRPIAEVLRDGVLAIDGTERLIYQPDERPTEPMAMPDGESSAALELGGGYIPSLAMQPPAVQRLPSRRTRLLWRAGGGRSAQARSSPKPR